MLDKFDENAFKSWLKNKKFFSQKASGDVVSRFKRCINIESFDGFKNSSSYFDAILKNPVVDTIPKSSRASMLRSCRLYFEFITEFTP